MHRSWRRHLKQFWGKHVSFQVVQENNYYTGKNRHQDPESQRFYLTVCSDQQCSAPPAGLKKQQMYTDWRRRRRAAGRKRRNCESFSPTWPIFYEYHVASFLWKIENFPTIVSRLQPGPHIHMSTLGERNIRLPGTNIPPPQIKR